MVDIIDNPKTLTKLTTNMSIVNETMEAAIVNKMKAMAIAENITIKVEPEEKERCKGYTRAGKQCTRKRKVGDYCMTHAKHVGEDGVYKKPAKAKRSRSSYIIFIAENREMIKSNIEGEYNFSKFQSMASSMWKEADKTKYEEMAKAEKVEFNKTHQKPVKEKKRSPNAYVLFKNALMKAEKEKGKVDFKEFQKLASSKWKEMSDEDKKPFVTEAAEKKKEFLAKKALTPTKPKRPLTSYNCWMKEWDSKIREENEGATFSEIGKIRAQKWALTKGDEEQMAKYKKLAEADKVRYEEELAAFIAAGGELKKKGKKKEPATIPVELLTDEEEEGLSLSEFTTTQEITKPYNSLLIDVDTNKVYNVLEGDEGEEFGMASGVVETEEGITVESITLI